MDEVIGSALDVRPIYGLGRAARPLSGYPHEVTCFDPARRPLRRAALPRADTHPTRSRFRCSAAPASSSRSTSPSLSSRRRSTCASATPPSAASSNRKVRWPRQRPKNEPWRPRRQETARRRKAVFRPSRRAGRTGMPFQSSSLRSASPNPYNRALVASTSASRSPSRPRSARARVDFPAKERPHTTIGFVTARAAARPGRRPPGGGPRLTRAGGRGRAGHQSASAKTSLAARIADIALGQPA
jgi:hypothetical protein